MAVETDPVIIYRCTWINGEDMIGAEAVCCSYCTFCYAVRPSCILDRIVGHNGQGAVVCIDRFNLDHYMGRAITYFNLDMLDEAKPILLQISEKFPDFEGAPQALAALALCYYKEGDCLNTIRYYQKLIDRYPYSDLRAEAYFHLGLCFERTGQNEKSKKALYRVTADYPDSVFSTQAQRMLDK